MRLRHVSVKGLFGIFDHEIPLNLDERITIIHGLNGYGKTIILQMIHEALSAKFGILATVPFNSFELTFDDEVCLRIESDGVALQRGNNDRVLGITYSGPRHTSESKRFAVGNPLGSLRRLQEKKQVRVAAELRLRTWLKELGITIPVAVVQTQRLLPPMMDSHSVEGPRGDRRPTVEAQSASLRREIQDLLTEYAAHSQELDRTFPSRLLEQGPLNSLSFEDFQRELVKLEERRSELTALGLLDPEQDLGPLTRTEDRTKLGVLSIYLQDVKSKLAVFDELAEKIALLLSIINERFRYKRLSIDREHGLVFTTFDDRPLPASALSSGEQHELVLLFTLLFHVERDSLVLIDEPELSLHLTWQQQFLPDLMRVVALSGFDVLIATHSADIIGEHWDLTVQLQGPPT